MKKLVTAENYPALYLALEERNLLYQGDRSGGFIEGWKAHANPTWREFEELRARIVELEVQIAWTTDRCNKAMGDDFHGTVDSAVAAVCDTLIAEREFHKLGSSGVEKAELCKKWPVQIQGHIVDLSNVR